MRLRFWSVPAIAVIVFSHFSGEESRAAEDGAVNAGISANQKETEADADPGPETQVSREAYSRERKFRQAEQAFVRWDINSNFVIDEDEWIMIYQEQRGTIPKEEWEQQPAKMKVMDADKDGLLSEDEVNAWIRERFVTRIKQYTKSELYKSRKAEYEKQQAGAAN